VFASGSEADVLCADQKYWLCPEAILGLHEVHNVSVAMMRLTAEDAGGKRGFGDEVKMPRIGEGATDSAYFPALDQRKFKATIVDKSLLQRLFGPQNVTILQQPSRKRTLGGSKRHKKVEHAFATSMVVLWREGPAASVVDFLVLWEPEARAGLG
jgi:hypothetical protein